MMGWVLASATGALVVLIVALLVTYMVRYRWEDSRPGRLLVVGLAGGLFSVGGALVRRVSVVAADWVQLGGFVVLGVALGAALRLMLAGKGD